MRVLEIFKKWLNPQKHEEAPVIITVHGYGRRRMHELDNLALWGKEDGLDIIQFDLFDIFDEKDCDWMKWVNRAKAKVDYYIMQNRRIYMVGFSMGGVIASYLASVCPVERLVLIAPAFNYLHVENITSMITKGASALLLSDKKEKNDIELPKSFYAAFSNTVKELKHCISEVHCPVLILHGDEDEVIPLRSSTQAYDKIPHDQKRLIILHEGHHRLLMDEKVSWEVYQLIRLFFNGILLPKEPKLHSPDYLDELKKQLYPDDEEPDDAVSEAKAGD